MHLKPVATLRYHAPPNMLSEINEFTGTQLAQILLNVLNIEY